MYEARAIGADCILLIVAALGRCAHARACDCSPPSSVSTCSSKCTTTRSSSARSRSRAPLIGINNRNLRTFETTLETTLRLAPHVPYDRLLVTESGIRTPEDVARLRAEGVEAFLVGETFMRAADPGAELARLFADDDA